MIYLVRPSSLLMSCGCISSSMASLISRSMYPVFAARSFVSCSFISCSWLMLRSATDDLSVLCKYNTIPSRRKSGISQTRDGESHKKALPNPGTS